MNSKIMWRVYLTRCLIWNKVYAYDEVIDTDDLYGL